MLLQHKYSIQPAQSPGITIANVAIFPQVTHGHQQVRQQTPTSVEQPWSGVVKICFGAQHLHAIRNPTKKHIPMTP